MVDRTVQWTMKTAMYGMNQAGRFSPGCGNRGSANVQTTRITVSETSASARRRPGFRNAPVKRKRR